MADYTLCLPTELAHSVLDLLTLSDIVRVSLTSQRWRSIAFEHPTYWSDIAVVYRPSPDTELKVDTSAAQMLDFAAARLTRSSSFPVKIRVVALTYSRVDGDELSRFLVAITSNMHRIQNLHLDLPARDIRRVLVPTFETRASLSLEELTIISRTDRAKIPAQPLSLMALNLRSMHLQNAGVTLEPGVVFPNLEDLSCWDAFLTDDSDTLPSCLPALQCLTVHGGSRMGFRESPSSSVQQWISQLHRLHTGTEVVRLFVNLGVLERIPYLCARFSGRIYDNALLRLVISHIPSASRRIGLRVTTDGHNELSATEVVRPISSRNPRKRVIESGSNTDLWSTSLWDYALLAQDFEMPPMTWGDVSHDSDFPCLQTLTIVEASTILDDDYPWRGMYSHLRVLRLKDNNVVLPFPKVRAIVQHCLKTISPHVPTLELHGIALEGDPTLLQTIATSWTVHPLVVDSHPEEQRWALRPATGS